MPLMPPSRTAAPRPQPSTPRPTQYNRRPFPTDGRPDAPPITWRLHGSTAYQHVNGEVPKSQDGFAPTLHSDVADPPGVPDPIRTGRRNPPIGTYEPERSVRRGADGLRRLAVETQHSTGWPIRQAHDQVPMDPDRVPTARDYLPTRPTATLSPNTYFHLRGDYPERPPYRTGEHFSLADHRRRYLIMGQRPVDRVGINTYRIEPAPWDTGLHVLPETERAATAVAVGRLAGNRSYRAGR